MDRNRLWWLLTVVECLCFKRSDFFKTFLVYSLQISVSKTTMKKIGHHARQRDMMGQSYPTIYAIPACIKSTPSLSNFKSLIIVYF